MIDVPTAIALRVASFLLLRLSKTFGLIFEGEGCQDSSWKGL